MKTIGAKELRLNLDKVLDDVLAGKEIVVKHRFKAPVRLVRYSSALKGNGIVIAQTLKRLQPEIEKHKSGLDPNKSIKELYRQSMAKKYGINR